MTSLQTFIKEIEALKPIPAVASRLLKIVDHPDSSMGDIANVIQYDPVITATVLKTCNAAYFGLKHPAESIADAVRLLGTQKVVELALLKSGAQTLSDKQEGYGLEQGEMWRYSVSSAVIARQIAIRLKLKSQNTLFTSALVKDMGKTILEKYVQKAAPKITRLVKNEQFSFQEAEKKILGIDHAELGAMMAKKWKFSSKMITIIRHHHLNDETMIKNREIAAVYLADCICMMVGSGVGSDGLAYRFKEAVMKNLGISAADLQMIIAEFGTSMQEVDQLLELT